MRDRRTSFVLGMALAASTVSSSVVPGTASAASTHTSTSTAAIGAASDASVPTPTPSEPYLGLSVASEGKLIVTAVVTASPAERAGIRAGDEIFGVNGKVINTVAELVAAIRASRAAETLELMVVSAERRSTRSLMLAPRPSGYPELGSNIEPTPPVESGQSSLGPRDGGFALGFSEQLVTAVHKPVDYAHLITWNLFMTQTFGGDAKTSGGGGGVGYRYLNPLGNFPGGSGGLTHNFSGELNFTGFFSASEFELPDIIGGGVERFMVGGARLTVLPSYTLMYFGGLNRKTGVQSGFGFKVGAELGGSVTLSYFSNTLNASFSPVVGPALGLELPSFNPGTSKVETFSLMFVVIPIEGVSLTVSTVGSF